MNVSGLLVFACVAALSIGCNGRGRTDNSIANNGNAAYDTNGAAGTSGSNAVSKSDKNFVNDQLSGGMVDDHEKDVSDVRSRVDEDRSVTDRLQGKNPENAAAVQPKSSDDRVTMAVNQWAANTLPTLEHHLDQAKQVKDNLGHAKRRTE